MKWTEACAPVGGLGPGLALMHARSLRQRTRTTLVNLDFAAPEALPC